MFKNIRSAPSRLVKCAPHATTEVTRAFRGTIVNTTEGLRVNRWPPIWFHYLDHFFSGRAQVAFDWPLDLDQTV
jgi:hypothetical protein